MIAILNFQKMPPETSEKFTITPDEYAATYTDGAERLAVHREAYESLIHRGISPFERSCERGHDPRRGNSVFEKSPQFGRNWLDHKYPFVAKGLAEMYGYGFFPGKDGYGYNPEQNHLDVDALAPFDTSNRHFDIATIIATVSYFAGQSAHRGKVIKTSEPAGVDTLIETGVTDKDFKKVLTALFRELLELKWIQETGSQMGNNLLHIRFKACVSRLVFLISEMIGRKSETGLPIPKHIQTALAMLENQNGCSRQELLKAHQILSDFMLMFFRFRGEPLNGSKYMAFMPAVKETSVGEVQQDLFLRIAEQAGFADKDFGIELKQGIPKEPVRYNNRVTVQRSFAEELHERANERILKVVRKSREKRRH
jgi:hypothetical protein